MWLLSKDGDGRSKRILINVETGAEIRLQELDNGQGKIVAAAQYDRGMGFTGVSLGTYAGYEDASQVFKKIAKHLNARDASSPNLDELEG